MEAMILNALVESQGKVEENVILTKDIRDTLNQDIPKKEQFKTTTVGRIMRRLGFLPKHTMRGNGWMWNDSRVSLLKMRYFPGDTTPGKGSYHSYHSEIQLTPVLEAEKCELCGQFPVKYEVVVDGQKIRRCQHCIEQMQEKGFKFTTLLEIS